MEGDVSLKVNQNKTFKLITSTSQIEKYIIDLAEKVKSKTKELSEFNPLKKIEADLLIEFDNQTYEAIYYILSKSIRTKNEILIMKVYLSSIKKLLSTINLIQGIDQILFYLSNSLRSEKKQENSIIYRYGEKGNRCYILIIGNISVLEPKENKVNCTFLMYFKHLILLNSINEIEILRKTINKNKYIFHITEEEIIRTINYIKKSLLKKTPFHQMKILNFKIGEITEIIEYYIYINENIVNRNIKNVCSVEDYINYTYLFNNKKRNENEHDELLTIYSYYEVEKKSQGDIFGEEIILIKDRKITRNSTVICIDECFLGIISREVYKNCILDVEKKKRRENLFFIHSFSLFNKIDWEIFLKIFNYFKIDIINHGESIIKQYSYIDRVFFIKEGIFQLNSNICANELGKILKEKRKMIFKPTNNFIHLEKKNYKISIIQNKDILGLKDIYFENKYYVEAICVSPEAIVFSISHKTLIDISEKIPELKRKLESEIKFREKLITDRLIEIYKNTEKTHGEEIKRKKIEKKNNLTPKEIIFKDILKKPEIGKKNRLNSSKTRFIFKEKIFSSINLSPIKKDNEITNNKKTNINYKIKRNKIRPVSSYEKKNIIKLNILNQYLSNEDSNIKNKKRNNINSTSSFTFKDYINTSTKVSNIQKKTLEDIPSFRYTNRLDTGIYLKSIIGNEYEEKKENINEIQFRKLLLDNQKTILKKRLERESPLVDLLYYDNKIIEMQNIKKKEKRNFKKIKQNYNASSYLLNSLNFNKFLKTNSNDSINLVYGLEKQINNNTIE